MSFTLIENKGFTLVELAIVMVIVGLLLGLSTSMVGPLITMSKTRDSREIVSAASDSLTSYASGNNTLPNAAGFPAAVQSPQDAWGRALLYLFDTNLAPPTVTKDTICGRRTTGISVVTAAPANTIDNVAYLVFSRGDNAAVDTTLTGTLNSAAIDGVITGTGTATGKVTLDKDSSDIVRWVTLDELRTKVGCQGAPLKIVNNELPYGTVGSPYPGGGTVTIVPDGGAGIFRWCIEAAMATPLPNPLAFSPAAPVRVPPLNTCSGTAENTWAAGNTLTISGTPNANTQGSYNFTVYVRDNNDAGGGNDNIASKSFVLTINP